MSVDVDTEYSIMLGPSQQSVPGPSQKSRHNASTTTMSSSFMNESISKSDLFGRIVDLLSRAGKKDEHDSIIKDLCELYQENDEVSIVKRVWRFMAIPFRNKGNPQCDNITLCFRKWIVDVDTFSGIVDSEGKPISPAVDTIVKLAKQYHSDENNNIRFGIIQTLRAILAHPACYKRLTEQNKLMIHNILAERISDKQGTIRTESILCMGYLVGESYDDKIKQRIKLYLRNDPTSEVRKAAVHTLPLDKKTLRYLVGQVQDINEKVRKAVFEVLQAKFKQRDIPTESIVKILLVGLQDSYAPAKQACVNLINHWLEYCNGDVVEMLFPINIFNNSKLGWEVLDELFPEKNAEAFDSIADKLLVERVVPIKDLTLEKIFVWTYLWENFAHVPYCSEKLYLTFSEFIEYARKFINEPMEEEEQDERRTVFFYIMRIFNCLPMEEGGRREASRVIEELFTCKLVDRLCTKPLVQFCHKIYDQDDVESAIVTLLEAVLFHKENENKENETLKPNCSQATSDIERDENLTVEQKQEALLKELKLELGSELHNIRKLESEKIKAVASQRFLEAHQLQEDIVRLESSAEKLRERIRKLETGEHDSTYINDDGEEVLELPDAPTQEFTSYSPFAVGVAMSAFTVHLQLSKKLSPSSKTFLEKYAYKFLTICDVPELRCHCIQAITNVGLLDKEEAPKAMVFSLKALVHEDEDDVMVMALKCVLDLILEHDFLIFCESPLLRQHFAEGDFDVTEEELLLSQQEDSQEPSVLKRYLFSFFRHPNVKVVKVIVTGMIKLLLADRISSMKVVSTLLLLWVNPANSDSKLVTYVSQWLPLFAARWPVNCIILVQSLVSCLHKMLNAPKHHPLYDASTDKLTCFVVSGTCQANLPSSIGYTEAYKSHLLLCNEVLKKLNPATNLSHYMTYAKILKMVDLRNAPKASLEQVKDKCTEVLSEPDVPGNVATIVQKFINALDKHIAVAP